MLHPASASVPPHCNIASVETTKPRRMSAFMTLMKHFTELSGMVKSPSRRTDLALVGATGRAHAPLVYLGMAHLRAQNAAPRPAWRAGPRGGDGVGGHVAADAIAIGSDDISLLLVSRPRRVQRHHRIDRPARFLRHRPISFATPLRRSALEAKNAISLRCPRRRIHPDSRPRTHRWRHFTEPLFAVGPGQILRVLNDANRPEFGTVRVRAMVAV